MDKLKMVKLGFTVAGAACTVVAGLVGDKMKEQKLTEDTEKFINEHLNTINVTDTVKEQA